MTLPITRARALLGLGKRAWAEALGISDNHRRALEEGEAETPRTVALAIAAQLLHRAAAVRAEADSEATALEREARALLMAHGAEPPEVTSGGVIGRPEGRE